MCRIIDTVGSFPEYFEKSFAFVIPQIVRIINIIKIIALTINIVTSLSMGKRQNVK